MIDTEPDPELSAEQQAIVDSLPDKDIAALDEMLLGNCSNRWTKVARIVGTTMFETPSLPDGIPDLYYASRIYSFIESGLLEHQGLVGHMRYCEVKFAAVD